MQRAKLKLKTVFAEERFLKGCRGAPHTHPHTPTPDVELGKAWTGAALGAWEPQPGEVLSGCSLIPISASLCLLALCLQSGFGMRQNQGHQQLLAHIFLFCHERKSLFSSLQVENSQRITLIGLGSHVHLLNESLWQEVGLRYCG